MSNQATKTNNDPLYFNLKVELRLESLPDKEIIYVLDAFGGEGLLWQEVQKKTKKQLKILSIDKNKYSKVNLQGENLKFIKGLDLKDFDIIDLDAWGSPYKLLEILFLRNYKGIVHCTFIQTMMGLIDKNLILKCGYSESMYKKCKTLLMKKPLEKLSHYLKINDVDKIKGYFLNNKNYFYFILDN